VVLHRVCPKRFIPRLRLTLCHLPTIQSGCPATTFLRLLLLQLPVQCLRLNLSTFIPDRLLTSLVSTAGFHTRFPFLRHLSMTFYLSSYYLLAFSRCPLCDVHPLPHVQCCAPGVHSNWLFSQGRSFTTFIPFLSIMELIGLILRIWLVVQILYVQSKSFHTAVCYPTRA
jgi:hypothetical protein